MAKVHPPAFQPTAGAAMTRTVPITSSSTRPIPSPWRRTSIWPRSASAPAGWGCGGLRPARRRQYRVGRLSRCRAALGGRSSTRYSALAQPAGLGFMREAFETLGGAIVTAAQEHRAQLDGGILLGLHGDGHRGLRGRGGRVAAAAPGGRAGPAGRHHPGPCTRTSSAAMRSPTSSSRTTPIRTSTCADRSPDSAKSFTYDVGRVSSADAPGSTCAMSTRVTAA